MSAPLGQVASPVELRHDIDALHGRRPRSRLLRVSIVLLLALVAYAWLCGDIATDEFFSARRWENLERFVTHDVRPFALRDAPLTLAGVRDWCGKLFAEHGRDGLLATLALSVLAITLAAIMALLLMGFAARNWATRLPFQTSAADAQGAPRAQGAGWRVLTGLVRALLVFLRAVPEYIWAYLFLAMLGASAWPAVLALAIHNAGILGKLGAETIENLDARPARALRELGASRTQLAASAVWPAFLSRFLLYFFYRFETCVREATVLGMLGVVSLGYWIQDARAKQFYDEMVFYVLLGALLVLGADLVSTAVRHVVRRAR